MSLRNAGIGVSEFRLNCEKFAEKVARAGQARSIRSRVEKKEGKGTRGISERGLKLGRKFPIKACSPPTSAFSGRCSPEPTPPRGTIKRFAWIARIPA